MNVFDPTHNFVGFTPQHTTQLEILNQKMQLIGDLLAFEGGSALPILEQSFHKLPANGICQNQVHCHGAGYVPQTRFIKGRELPPGFYYLRVVVMSSFFLSEHQNDPTNKRRIAESKPVRIELLARSEPMFSKTGK